MKDSSEVLASGKTADMEKAEERSEVEDLEQDYEDTSQPRPSYSDMMLTPCKDDA